MNTALTRASTSVQQSQAPSYSPAKRPSVTLPALPNYDLTGLHKRYMYDGELAALIYLIADVKPHTVIEFGTNSGRTAKAILRNVPGIQRYTGIDVPRGHVTNALVQRNEVPDQPGELAFDDGRYRVLLARNGSHDLAPDDLPFADAAFIDGDHSVCGVRRDYVLAKSKLRAGGIIIFHDDNGRNTIGVSQVLDEFAEGGAVIKHVEGTWLAFERIV